MCALGGGGGGGLLVGQVVGVYDRGVGDEECLVLLFKNVVSYVCRLPFNQVAPPRHPSCSNTTLSCQTSYDPCIVCKLHCFTVYYVALFFIFVI